MEGERAFVQQLKELKGKGSLLKNNSKIAYKYSMGGGYRKSHGWEPLGLVGYYDTFGPELSFGEALGKKLTKNIAIAKFTHSGSQIIDWTPEGSMAEDRHLYPRFISFIKEAIKELTDKGNQIELTGIFYHLGENDMSFHPYRKQAAERLQAIINQSRKDLEVPELKWFVSQQRPTDDKRVNNLDVVADVEKMAAGDKAIIHLKAFDLPPQEKKLVIDTSGIVRLGEFLAKGYLKN
jgi:hypothetical protein